MSTVSDVLGLLPALNWPLHTSQSHALRYVGPECIRLQSTRMEVQARRKQHVIVAAVFAKGLPEMLEVKSEAAH